MEIIIEKSQLKTVEKAQTKKSVVSKNKLVAGPFTNSMFECSKQGWQNNSQRQRETHNQKVGGA